MIADLAMQRALDRYRQAGVAGLTPKEKTLATLWYFESKVANSGFERFFKSDAGELAAYAPTAFRTVGVEALAVLAERANAVFGQGGVPADRARRVEALDQLSGEQKQVFDELEAEYLRFDRDIDGRVEAFLRADPSPPQI